MRKIQVLLTGLLLLLAASGCGFSRSPSQETAHQGSVPSDAATASQAGSEASSASGPAATDPPEAPAPSVLKKITFHSEALGTDKRMQVYLPPGFDRSRRYPVLYMLHGYYGTENAWMPEMHLEQAADRLIAEGRLEPMIIAAPEMDNSYGLNSSEQYRLASPKDPVHSRYYGRYEDYFVQDVIGYVDEHFPTIASREGRYVGGYSMGGFISLHAAFRHPDLFSKAGGHSAALWTDDWSRVPNMKSWLYPTAAARKARDPLELAKTQDLTGMAVYLDCGDHDDFKLYDGARKLYRILQDRGIASEFHLNPGNHSRTYWGGQVENYLLFYGGKPTAEKGGK